MSEPLISFWIIARGAPLGAGYGVTVFSEPDALRLIREAGYELPTDSGELEITAGVRPDDVDPKHIAQNSGPSVVRGVWHPFVRVGV
jgi:hypothetical protein